MKSFFKKLAFVMALAMVVSSVAPAAANAAEETEVILVPQTGEAIETQLIVFTEGDEPQDFRFLNAPANWRETYKWTTVDPTIATVDTSGVVTPVAVGQTMLQLWIGGEVVAQAKILVNPVSKVDEFTLTQKSATQLTATFVEASKLDLAKDFQLYIVYPQEGADDIVVKWPAAFAIDDAKKVVTVTPSIALGHNDHYRLVAGSYTQDVETKIEKVDTLKLSLPATVGRNFYVDTEYSITPSFLAGNVDLTSLHIDKYDVIYTVELVDKENFTNDDFDWDVNPDTLALEISIFEKGLELAIGAKLVDEKENQITTATASVIGTAKPEWAFDGKVVDWAIIKEDACCVDWDVKSIPADKSNEGQYSIVLKFKDGDGKTYVTHPQAVQEGDIDHANNYNHDKAENIYITGDVKNADALTAAGYEVYLYSTDNSLMLVDEETGALGVYVPATVSFYVKLVHYNAVTDEETERYIYANEVEITEATKLDEVYQKKSGVINVVKEVLDGEDESEMSTEVEFVVEDQYDEPWGQFKLTAYYLDKDGKKIYITDENGQTSKKIVFTSGQFYAATSSEVKVTVEAASTAILATEKDSTTVTVKITAPGYNYNDKGDVTGIKLDTVTKNRYYTYSDVEVKGGKTNVQLAADATDYQVSGTIQLYKISNGVKVGLWRVEDDLDVNYDADNKPVYSTDWVAITSEDDIKDMTEEGSRYVVMRDPSGKIVPLSWNNNVTGDKLVYKLNTAVDVDKDLTDDQLVYAATGTYTVEAVIVRYNTRNGNSNNIVRKGSVTVEDKTKHYYVVKATKNTFSGAECKTGNTINLDDVVLDVFEFGLDNKTATINPEWIADVKAVKLNDAVILQYVVLHVPVAKTGLYYEQVLSLGNTYIKDDGTVAKAQ